MTETETSHLTSTLPNQIQAIRSIATFNPETYLFFEKIIKLTETLDYFRFLTEQLNIKK